VIAALCFTRGLSFAFASSNGGHSSLPQLASIAAFVCVCGIAVLFECWRRGYFNKLFSNTNTMNSSTQNRHHSRPRATPRPPSYSYPFPPNVSPARPRRASCSEDRRRSGFERRRDRRDDDIESRRRQFREQESYYSDERYSF